MAGFVDKIKGMLTKENTDALKEKAGVVKGKVDDMVVKAGDKVPPKVKQTYDKVSDKVDGVLVDDDAATTDATVTPGAEPDGTVETPPPASH